MTLPSTKRFEILVVKATLLNRMYVREPYSPEPLGVAAKLWLSKSFSVTSWNSRAAPRRRCGQPDLRAQRNDRSKLSKHSKGAPNRPLALRGSWGKEARVALCRPLHKRGNSVLAQSSSPKEALDKAHNLACQPKSSARPMRRRLLKRG